MDMITWYVKLPSVYSVNLSYSTNNCNKNSLFLRFCNYPSQFNINSSPFAITHAKNKKNSQLESSILQPTFIQELIKDDDDDDEEDDLLITDDFYDEGFQDDGEDYFADEYATENAESFVSIRFCDDGAEGGGMLLAGTWWDKEALSMAELVAASFDGDIGLYAFRTLVNATIQVRIEKLSTKSGSPSMYDIEAFSEAYRTRLDEAELAKTIPDNVTLEVSSPGVERIIRIPQELERFRERPMHVKYVTEAADSSSKNDGIFKLISYDLETECCTWGLADVRINREKAGKGRPMSKKQCEWQVTTHFDSIRLVRLYSEI